MVGDFGMQRSEKSCEEGRRTKEETASYEGQADEGRGECTTKNASSSYVVRFIVFNISVGRCVFKSY